MSLHLDVEYEVVPHARTMRAVDEAEATGSPQTEVGKTLILRGRVGYIRAVIPASERLDLHKVKLHLDDPSVRMATEEELLVDYPQYELGAVPPVGGPDDAVLVDSRIAKLDRVVFEAGTHDESIRMRAADLVAVTGAGLADLCAD